MLQHEEKLDRGKIKLISFISFLIGFSQAIIIYILSSYFKFISGSENVGAFYLISYSVVLLILLNLHRLVRVLGKTRVLCFTVLAKVIVLFSLMLIAPSKISLGLAVLYLIFAGVEWVAIDVILESCSEDRFSGRIRGFHLTIYNLGFLFRPLLSARLLGKFGFHGIFLALFFLNCLVLIIALLGFRKVNHCLRNQLGVRNVLRKMSQRKEMAIIYYISFTLEFFFALMVIFVPLYLIDQGFSWADIGWIFTIMLVPFVILQYPAGFLADRKWKEKNFLIASLFIMFFSVLAIFFINSKSIFIWGIILFATRIGPALIEVLRDSYFYKQVDDRDVDLIHFFRTAMPMGYIVATAISSIVLIYFPIKSAFIIVAIIVASAIYPAFKLKDVKFKYPADDNY